MQAVRQIHVCQFYYITGSLQPAYHPTDDLQIPSQIVGHFHAMTDALFDMIHDSFVFAVLRQSVRRQKVVPVAHGHKEHIIVSADVGQCLLQGRE